jgi:uncharacterized protein with FMN-binding domain
MLPRSLGTEMEIPTEEGGSSGFFAMKLLQTAKACFLSLAIVPLAGASFALAFDISRWIVPVSAAAMLLAIGILVSVQRMRSRREYRLPPEPVIGDRVSNRLVVLSSAAVLAVYSAGYFRTRAAADQLAARTAKQLAARAALVSVQVSLPAPAALPPANESSQIPDDSSQPRKKPSNAAGARAPAARSASATSAGTSSDSAANDDQGDSGPGDSAAPRGRGTGRMKDGRFQGRGSSPHGDIVAEVVIHKGQIIYAGIAQCLTRYSCSVIKGLPEQVVVRQSTDVDVVSGATESTDAFQDGISEALLRAHE